jgi:hypothetical protein
VCLAIIVRGEDGAKKMQVEERKSYRRRLLRILSQGILYMRLRTGDIEFGGSDSVRSFEEEYRGRILVRNWDKSRMSFPPSYLQSPLLTNFTPPPPRP